MRDRSKVFNFVHGLRRMLPVLLIVGVGLLVYSRAWQGSFQFDDQGFIVENAAIHNLSDIPAIWKAHRIPVRFVAFYTFALNYHGQGLNPVGYHWVNILIHLMMALCVWQLVRLIGRTPVMSSTEWVPRMNSVALVAALLFVAHPIQTQAVTYITQRFASLAALWYVAGLCCYCAARLTESSAHRMIGFGCALVCAVLAMFTKENAFTWPLMIGLIEWVFFMRTGYRDIRWRWPIIFVVSAMVLLMVIPLLYGLDLSAVFPEQLESQSHDGDVITSGTYALTQARVIPRYLRLMLWPIGQNLDYDIAVSPGIRHIPTLAGIIFLGGLIGWAFRLRRSHPLLSFGMLWFFIAMIIEAGCIPIRNVMFEHRLYLPSVGICLVFSALLHRLWSQRWMIICVVVLTVTLGTLTMARNEVWRTPERLWTDAAVKSPGKSRPVIYLGNIYLDQRRYTEAVTAFTLAVPLVPDDHTVYNNRGLAYAGLQKYNSALNDYNRAIECHPRYAVAFNNRGNVYQALKKWDLALVDYGRALAIRPDYSRALNNRAVLYNRQGLYDLAIADWTRAVEIDPDYHEAKSNLTVVRVRRPSLK